MCGPDNHSNDVDGYSGAGFCHSMSNTEVGRQRYDCQWYDCQGVTPPCKVCWLVCAPRVCVRSVFSMPHLDTLPDMSINLCLWNVMACCTPCMDWEKCFPTKGTTFGGGACGPGLEASFTSSASIGLMPSCQVHALHAARPGPACSLQAEPLVTTYVLHAASTPCTSCYPVLVLPQTLSP